MTQVPHEYVDSWVGHGEGQCKWCFGTNRENAIIAPNHCGERAKRDPAYKPRHSDTAFAEDSKKLAQTAEELKRWRYVHTKSKGVYDVLAVGRLEGNLNPVCTYRNVHTGEVWTRDLDEFMDGRFEPAYEMPKLGLAPDNVSELRRYSVTVGAGMEVFGEYDAVTRVQNYILLDSTHPVEKEDVRRMLMKQLNDAEQKLKAEGLFHKAWQTALEDHFVWSYTGSHDTDIRFFALALAGEAGEAIEAILIGALVAKSAGALANFAKKEWRDNAGGKYYHDMQAECADVLAYTMMLAAALGMTPYSLLAMVTHKHDVFVEKMKKLAAEKGNMS